MKILSFLIVLFCSVCCNNPAFKSLFVVWNVGQGAWASLITFKECIHFDMGGELNPTLQVRSLCQKKVNKIFLSHSDFDHRSWLASFPLPLCRLNVLKPTAEAKWPQWAKLKLCSSNEVKVIYGGDSTTTNSNSSSQVVWVPRFKVLIPGDSTSREEKQWAPFVDPSIRYLILGHHGSKTSTSLTLLKQLPSLTQAFASARKLKYGHPHKEVKSRLQNQGVALLSTEEWGTVVIYQ